MDLDRWIEQVRWEAQTELQAALPVGAVPPAAAADPTRCAALTCPWLPSIARLPACLVATTPQLPVMDGDAVRCM